MHFVLIFLTNVTYILHEAVDDSPPPEVLSHNYRGLYFIFYILPPIWPKELRGKENENLWTIFVQKLEQNDQKCVYFYILANICKGEEIWSPQGGGGRWKKYDFQCNAYIDPWKDRKYLLKVLLIYLLNLLLKFRI